MLKKEEIHEIRIRLNNMKELFNTLDPSPAFNRDLDGQVADYITSSVKEASLKKKMKIIIMLPVQKNTPKKEVNIKKAIVNYYDYMITIGRRKIKNLLKEGRMSLLIGLSFLFLSLIVSDFAAVYLSGFLSMFLSEGILIAGWVSMWRPISIFLYDWWPLAKEIMVFHKISDMDISIETYNE